MKSDSKFLTLYAVTDSANIPTTELCRQVKAALEGGITCLQLRDKGLSGERLLHRAEKIRELCREYGVPFIVNDDVETAVRSCADGVHVGQTDLAAAAARKLIGPDMILGVSANTVADALKAQAAGADYIGVGAVFATDTKKDADAVSIQTLTDICAAVDIPVVAIGGIKESNIGALRGSGAAGVAVVSAIFSAPDITEACRRLKALARQI